MAVTNRATKLAKLHKVARKHYQPVKPPADRSVLEHLLYACCLEDSRFEDADEAFARLQQGFFDWNEVRVTTAAELAEVMDCLSEPNVAATRLKKTLHSMFETHYAFDIDSFRKENLGKAMQKIGEYNGVTHFVVAYVAQNGLGGHSIGVDQSLINLMYTIGVIDEKEAQKGQIPGMERAIAKNKGVEFFSLTHQMAVAYTMSPFNNDVRALLTSIDATARERFPKRNRKKKKPETKKAPPAPAKEKPSGKPTKTKSAQGSKATTATRKTAAKPAAKKKVAASSTSRSAASKTVKKKPTARKTAVKKDAARKTSKKAGGKKTARTTKKTTARKSPSKRLAKKKPR